FIRPAIYADWLANIVPVLKRKTGEVRICVDYRNLNEASPKDEYPMPMADMLIDGAAHNQMLSFMDGNAGKIQPFSSLLKTKAGTNIQVGRTAPTGFPRNKRLPLKSTSSVPTKERQTTQTLCICIRGVHWKS
ncbi:PREDICTED: retrotransposon unclassified, partial [Prunus dulcis]